MKLRTLDEVIETDFREDFADPEFAAGYLQAVLEEAVAADDEGAYEVALGRVAKARLRRRGGAGGGRPRNAPPRKRRGTSLVCSKRDLCLKNGCEQKSAATSKRSPRQ